MRYMIVVQVDEVSDDGDGNKTVIPRHCPAVFDTLEEAETYCDDLMIGE